MTLTEEPLEPYGPAPVPPLLARAAAELAGRTVWHLNTTALGGGVAELLRRTVPAHAAAGLDSRWLVAGGSAEFFTLTKQLHHLLHGSPGDGGVPTDAALYRRVTAALADQLLARTGPRDLVVLHDPQVLGLAPVLRRAGLPVLWRSHIGTHRCSPLVDAAWRFLGPYAAEADQLLFSSPRYVPAVLAGRPVTIVPPAIDPVAAKCRPMDAGEVAAVLAAVGLQGPPTGALGAAGRVRQDEPLPPDAPALVQISRWDPLKDMAGVLAAYAGHVAPHTDLRLVLAGPDPAEVSDDPENATVLAGTLDAVERLPAAVRRRVHVVVLRLSARTENHTVVNALQRRAAVVAQKSLEEGFGLAVTEALHKRRPVVAAAVGGIRDQVADREHALLVEPRDLAGFGAAVRALAGDPALADRLAGAGQRHVARHYLIDREHEQYARLFLAAAR